MNLILVGKILGVAGFLGGTFGLGMILRNQKSESTAESNQSIDENIYLYAVSSRDGDAVNETTNTTTDSFRCQFGDSTPINCELSKLPVNDTFKQHNIKDIQATSATNNDLSDFQSFFQIKFTGLKNWNKLSSVTNEFNVFPKSSSETLKPHKHIIFSAEVATYKNNTKIFRSAAFVVKASTTETFDRKDTVGNWINFKCDFEQSEGNQTEDCRVKNFSTDTDFVVGKKYDEIKFDSANSESTSTITKEKYYLITLTPQQNINNLHKKQITLNTTGGTKIIFENLANATVSKNGEHLFVL